MTEWAGAASDRRRFWVTQRGEVKSVLSFAKPCDHPIYDFIVRDIENSSSIPSFSLMHLAGHFPLASTLRVSVKAMGVVLCISPTDSV